MVKPTPSRFNPDLLARDPAQYSVSVPLSQFKRLQEFLLDETVTESTSVAGSEADSSGMLTAEFRFSVRQKTTMVAGTFRATFLLECQRCLEPVQHSVEAPFEFAFAKDEATARAMPDEVDPVVLDDAGQIHVVDLFEDELILHVPSVPKHVESDTCVVKEHSFGEVEESIEPAGRRPFDVLKKLDLPN